MKRRGFALHAALWLVVIIAVVVGAALREQMLGLTATYNRISLLRASWARKGCWEAARAAAATERGSREDTTRFRPDAFVIDSLYLFADAWCESTVLDLGARLNVNLASEESLYCLIGEPARELVRARPFRSDEELKRRFAQRVSERVLDELTTRGPGQLNANTVSAALLACLPGWDRAAAFAIEAARHGGESFGSLAQVIARLPLASQRAVSARSPELHRTLSTSSSAYLVTVIGHSGVHDLQVLMRLEIAPLGPSWSVLRTEVE